MTRPSALALLIAAGTVSVTATAYQNPPAAKVVEAQQLKDNLYMLTGAGGGGNTAVFIGTNGVTVVDTKNPEWGAPILAKIKELTPKPVTTIINTHTHGDHVSGNVEFPATVEVIVQENTKTNMEKLPIFAQSNGRGLPKRTFKDKLSIGSGSDQIDLYYFGRGHTNGDAFVVFPALRVMHAGDIFSGKNLPLLDANNGGSGVEIGDSLSKAADGIRNIEAIITGHSTVMTVGDMREYAQFNKDFVADVRAGLAGGQSADDIAGAWRVNESKYKGYNVQDARVKSNVQFVVNELKK